MHAANKSCIHVCRSGERYVCYSLQLGRGQVATSCSYNARIFSRQACMDLIMRILSMDINSTSSPTIILSYTKSQRYSNQC